MLYVMTILFRIAILIPDIISRVLQIQNVGGESLSFVVHRCLDENTSCRCVLLFLLQHVLALALVNWEGLNFLALASHLLPLVDDYVSINKFYNKAHLDSFTTLSFTPELGIGLTSQTIAITLDDIQIG